MKISVLLLEAVLIRSLKIYNTIDQCVNLIHNLEEANMCVRYFTLLKGRVSCTYFGFFITSVAFCRMRLYSTKAHA